MDQKAFNTLAKQANKPVLQGDQVAAPEAGLSHFKDGSTPILHGQSGAEPEAFHEGTDQCYRLYIMAWGSNSAKKGFPQHTWLAFLEDGTGRLLWTNADIRPVADDGSQFDVLLIGLRESMDNIPPNAPVFILSPQKGLVDLYLKTREQRREGRYRGSDKKPRPQADILREIDDVTEKRGITLIGRMPELHHEYDRLKEVKEGAADRWAACGADGL